MRKSLIVGIQYYEHGDSLFGCINDANAVKEALERHEDGTKNFDCITLRGRNKTETITRGLLKDCITELFQDDCEIALFYFSGHGYLEETGGYLLASDSRRGDEGVSLSEILTLANQSPAKNKIIILDSCHSGIAGSRPENTELAILKEGVTILTASTAQQYATEINNKGVFTELLVDALGGGAANLAGDITPGSVYAHIDQSLGAWKQRPVFKTNVKQFVSLRKVTPAIKHNDLLQLTKLFPSSDFEFALDPTYEPEITGRPSGAPPPIKANTEKFALLQKYNRVNLLIPVGAPHMWNAAMQRKACKLTRLGKHYWRLVKNNRI